MRHTRGLTGLVVVVIVNNLFLFHSPISPIYVIIIIIIMVTIIVANGIDSYNVRAPNRTLHARAHIRTIRVIRR